MSRPPISGPDAVATETVVAMVANARARASPEKYFWMSPNVCGLSIPEPTPCRSRARLSISIDGASPAITAPTTNTATPARNRRLRPLASPSRPDGTSSSPNASAYPDTTHCRPEVSDCRSRPITGSATLMTDSASNAMNSGTISAARMRAVRTGGSAVPATG